MGGVEQVIAQIARGTHQLGVGVDVLSLTADPQAGTVHTDGYRAHRARINFEIASTGFSASAFLQFKRMAKEVDLIHYHFPWPFMDMVHFASRVNKPTLVTYHSDIIRQKNLLRVYRPLMHRFLSSVDSIVATSPNYLATSNVLSQYASKVRVIPIGLDKAAYATPTQDRLRHWRDALGPKFFLFVGVLRYYKGLHVLIEAAQDTNFPVVIVGAGPIEQELRDQVARMGLRNVFFLGYLDEADKVALLMLCYAVLFPSHLRSEAFGISLLEGAMFGKPLISSEIGTGTTYINIAGETGLVVPPSDPLALRQAMQYLWTHTEDAARMGLCAEQRYWKHFTAAQMSESYVNAYADAIGKHTLTQ
jgi:glycosyltransferase involved in cell wall biosynthesis